jgi:hypothetical protein
VRQTAEESARPPVFRRSLRGLDPDGSKLLPALTGLDDESRTCERRQDEDDPEGLSLE